MQMDRFRRSASHALRRGLCLEMHFQHQGVDESLMDLPALVRTRVTLPSKKDPSSQTILFGWRDSGFIAWAGCL